LNPLDYHVWGNVTGLLQAPSKTEESTELMKKCCKWQSNSGMI